MAFSWSWFIGWHTGLTLSKFIVRPLVSGYDLSPSFLCDKFKHYISLIFRVRFLATVKLFLIIIILWVDKMNMDIFYLLKHNVVYYIYASKIESLTLKHKYLFENCEILCNIWNKQYKLFLSEYNKKKITGNLSPLTLLARIPLRRGVFNTPLCDKVCQWLATGYSGFLHHKTDHHDITKILLKVALNTITNNVYSEQQW
jgi:hypothetical protein